MNMSERVINYRFGPYEVRMRTQELYKHGIKLKLRPRTFHLLKALAEHAGDVVTREELQDLLWPAGTFVDFEHGLNTSVKELRAALGDSANEPTYIETLPKVGYRMTVSVEREDRPGSFAARDELPNAVLEFSHSANTLVETKPKRDRRWTWTLYGALVLVVAALAAYWQGRRLMAPSDPPARFMLAVLPFENLTGDSSQEYFSDGLTEEMIAQLGRLDPKHVGVIARTSVMHYKAGRERLDQIGRELRVQYVLEGSVRRNSQDVRISAQLIRVKDQAHTWAKEYDRHLVNLLALQDEVAREIADEIELTLTDDKPRVPTPRASWSQQQYEAHDLYLKGLFFWNQRHLPEAVKYFQEALNKDAKDAPAYAMKAYCYALMGGYTGEPRPEYLIQARNAALQALEIDESLPEAHAALAVILQKHDWNWQTAEKEYLRAIELNSSYATAHHWYAEHLGLLGRFDDAFRESERARELDPLSLIIASDNAMLSYYARQYDRSIQQFAAVADLDPSFPRAAMVVFPYAETGRFAEALARLESTRQATESGPWFWSQLAYLQGRSGRHEEAQRALEKLENMSRFYPIDPAVFVMAYIGTGNKSETFTWLEKAYRQHSDLLTALKVDPMFDPLRGDPRFRNLARRIGL